MRKSRFTAEQILQALRQAEAGTPVVEICRKMAVTETTFYPWKKCQLTPQATVGSWTRTSRVTSAGR